MKLCQFVDTDGGFVTYINPSQVRVVEPDPDEPEVSTIVFDDDHSIPVRGSVEEVVKKLNDALRV